jgi:hypothetical protein
MKLNLRTYIVSYITSGYENVTVNLCSHFQVKYEAVVGLWNVWGTGWRSFIETNHTPLPNRAALCEHRERKKLSFIKLINPLVSDEYYLKQLPQYKT